MAAVPKWLMYAALAWLMAQIMFTSAYESYPYLDYEEDGSHRSRRNVIASYTPPQPTAEYPVVLFSHLNYNNDTNTGYYHRLGRGEFRVWGRTIDNFVRQFVFRSMLFLPNTNVTFQACCWSGNTFTTSMRNIENISNIHLWLFDNKVVGGDNGIFYTEWDNWMMAFSMRADRCQSSCPTLPCNGPCYFGSCSEDGSCQCAHGYSGSQCETRPSVSGTYPTLQYPLILFPLANFKGAPLRVTGNEYGLFAQNRQKTKSIKYSSLRVLFQRRLTFSRVDHSETEYLATGSDIEDIPAFMVNNPDLVADTIWFNYASDIDLDFAVKVEDVPACTNCSTTGGCCYTGTCQCLPGYTGANCESST